jgi:hypothetical protein
MKQLNPSQFCKAMVGHFDSSRIVYVGGKSWQAQCPAGVLATHEGITSFDNLAMLLAILAGVGIRTIRVEWDGLPAITD